MLTKEANELLTQVGPGTPMGTLFRSYWIPALFSEEIPSPDCPPVRVKLLGEELLAFRDTEGKVAIVDEYCPHRRASLFYGRNEQCGIRCAYHGWKFDADGTCVDLPSEPPTSNFKHKVKLTAYPCKENSGLVWVYMGDQNTIPEFRELNWMKVPNSQRYIAKCIQETNFMTGIEGTFDSAHINFLHSGTLFVTENSRSVDDMLNQIPKIYPIPKEHGVTVGALRSKSENVEYCRISQFIMPFFSMVLEAVDDDAHAGFVFVPMDDENTYVFTVSWNKRRDLTADELNLFKSGQSIHNVVIPGTFKPVANRTNDYNINRKLQSSGVSFTGIDGIAAEDLAVQESSGRILDRTKERLGTSDVAIIAIRKRLMDAAISVVEGGKAPGLHIKDIYPLATEITKDENVEEVINRYFE